LAKKELVRLMIVIQKLTVAVMVAGGDSDILLPELCGSLQECTNTVVLTTIGMLIKEEIL